MGLTGHEVAGTLVYKVAVCAGKMVVGVAKIIKQAAMVTEIEHVNHPEAFRNIKRLNKTVPDHEVFTSRHDAMFDFVRAAKFHLQLVEAERTAWSDALKQALNEVASRPVEAKPKLTLAPIARPKPKLELNR